MTVAVLVGGLGFMMVRSRAIANAPQCLPLEAYFELDGHQVQLEVARTPAQQAKGLQFREPLPGDRGMLFPVEPATPAQLWMKDVAFPLDMIFLSDGTVIHVAKQVPPCNSLPQECPVYGPEEAVDAVIELTGGAAERLGIQEGTQIAILFLD